MFASCTAETQRNAERPHDRDSPTVAPDASPDGPWEAARRRGADFRAIGQEPGWILEIHENEHLHYVGDYGRDTVTGSLPQSGRRGSAVVYAVAAGDRTVRATVRERPCQDVMSGESFTHTVDLRIDQHQFIGCGRRL